MLFVEGLAAEHTEGLAVALVKDGLLRAAAEQSLRLAGEGIRRARDMEVGSKKASKSASSARHLCCTLGACVAAGSHALPRVLCQMRAMVNEGMIFNVAVHWCGAYGFSVLLTPLFLIQLDKGTGQMNAQVLALL